MSFVFSDSCENHTTREKVLAKCSDKSLFSEYLCGSKATYWRFPCVDSQSNACTNMRYKPWRWWKKKRGQEAKFQETTQKEWACLLCGESFRGFWSYCPSVLSWPAQLEKIKARLSSDNFESENQTRNPWHAAGARWVAEYRFVLCFHALETVADWDYVPSVWKH